MKKRKKYIPHLIIAFLSFIGLFLFITIFEPSVGFDLKVFTLPSVVPFFFLLFLSLGGLMTFLLVNVRRGILVGIFVVVFLLLQYLHVNNVLYSLLLLTILLLIEFLFVKKK